jgi:hypothetical protein
MFTVMVLFVVAIFGVGFGAGYFVRDRKSRINRRHCVNRRLLAPVSTLVHSSSTIIAARDRPSALRNSTRVVVGLRFKKPDVEYWTACCRAPNACFAE